MNHEESRKHIEVSLNKDLRFDERKKSEYREITIEPGVSKNAEGSARVKVGETEVIAGIKLEIGKPYPDQPDQGSMMIGAELLPMSSPDFESGPPGIKAIELARVVDRGIRESKAIDTKKLCVEVGEKAWIIVIDICSINDAGNLMDTSALAVLAALKNTKFPKYEDGVIDYKTKTDKVLPILHEPIAVTVIKIGNHFIVDPTTEEEKFIEARLTVTFMKDGRICAMQKGGATPLTEEEISQMIDFAKEKSEELRKKLK